MIGLGTIVNTAAVVVGGLLGMVLKKGIAQRFEKILMQALGLATMFIGMGGVLKYMLYMENGALSTRGTMLLVFSLVIGAIIGWLVGSVVDLYVLVGIVLTVLDFLKVIK